MPMQAGFFALIETGLSPARLGSYGTDKPGPCIILARYLLNSALAESLYSPLQLCEVALRNSIHAELSRLFGRTDWYDDPGFNLLPWAATEIQKAKQKIIKTNKPITPGGVVAELAFGFWTSLFEPHYEMNTPFLPGGIKRVFPHLPKSLHNRKNRKADLENIRALRNRVFHHERIIHFTDLNKRHQLILDVIGWISPELRQMADVFDRFTPMRSGGLPPWIAAIQAKWPASPPPPAGTP